MSLSKKQLKNVCLQYSGSTECRYLGSDRSTGNSLCMRLISKEKKARDKAVSDHFADCKKRGHDAHQQWPGQNLYIGYHTVGLGTGAGCQGYAPLTQVTQGYDV